MPSRRALLASAAAVVVTGGCLGRIETTGGEQGPLDSGERVSGEAEPIATEADLTGPSYEYVEANDTVRYRATTGGRDESEHSHAPFEDWAHVKSAITGSDAVHEHLSTLFDSMDGISPVVARAAAGEYDLVVEHRTVVDGSGTVVDEPPVDPSGLVAETPESVTATVILVDRSATHSFPVFVRHDEVETSGSPTEAEG